jgi:inorganic triphosphatase YgiF
MQPDPALLARSPLRKLGNGNKKLLPGVRTDIERTVWLVHRRNGVIEVALDTGVVVAGGMEAGFDELELELKEGESRALFELARAMVERAPLRLGVISKQERGERLFRGEQRAEKAQAATIDGRMAVGQVFAQIFNSCIRQFRLNELHIVEQSDAEALHQARIAMRRLRGALTLFRPAIRRSTIKPWRDELRWLTRSLANARDIDVFIQGHHHSGRGDRRKLNSARRAAYREASAAIDSDRLRGLLLDLVEWMSIGDWRKSEAKRPIEKFAASRLDALWKDVKHDAANIPGHDDEQLHRLRIGIKKLRYAVEFLDSLYGRKAKKFSAGLAEIQDCLGEMRDAAVARQLIDRLSLKTVVPPGSTDADGERLAAVERQFQAIRKIGGFWS